MEFTFCVETRKTHFLGDQTTLDWIKRLFIFNAYFRFRHASVTNGAVVAESRGSIHGSSSFVLGEAAQYRTQGRRRSLTEKKEEK